MGKPSWSLCPVSAAHSSRGLASLVVTVAMAEPGRRQVRPWQWLGHSWRPSLCLVWCEARVLRGQADRRVNIAPHCPSLLSPGPVPNKACVCVRASDRCNGGLRLPSLLTGHALVCWGSCLQSHGTSSPEPPSSGFRVPREVHLLYCCPQGSGDNCQENCNSVGHGEGDGESILSSSSCQSNDKPPKSNTSPIFHPVDGDSNLCEVASGYKGRKRVKVKYPEFNLVLFLSTATCMTLGKALNFFGPQFLHRE